jgi:hypothetical protein
VDLENGSSSALKVHDRGPGDEMMSGSKDINADSGWFGHTTVACLFGSPRL